MLDVRRLRRVVSELPLIGSAPLADIPGGALLCLREGVPYTGPHEPGKVPGHPYEETAL